MKWKKKGLILKPSELNISSLKSHTSLPVCDIIDDQLRIYFSYRDFEGRSNTTYLTANPQNPSEIIEINKSPILKLGELGTFDESGIMPSSIVSHNGKKFLYYIGWNIQHTVSYRLSIGLAISNDNGKSFEKVSNGPICDRERNEPYFNTAPFVLVVDGRWIMYYVSCTEWKMIDNYPEPKYHIKMATSRDGINWEKEGTICIDYTSKMEALGKPCVFIEDGIYKMFFSYRKLKGYRTESTAGYKLGYAESNDGIHWEVGEEDLITNTGEWDSIMREYSSTYAYNGKRYLIYNGNGFGETGIGYAETEL